MEDRDSLSYVCEWTTSEVLWKDICLKDRETLIGSSTSLLSSKKNILLENILEVIHFAYRELSRSLAPDVDCQRLRVSWRDFVDLGLMNETSGTLGIKEEHAEINVSVHLDTEFSPLSQKTNKFV